LITGTHSRLLMRLISPRAAVALACGTLVGSCGGGSTVTPGNSQTMTKFAGDGQSANHGAAVSIAPAVRIVDQNNAAVSGVSVTFVVASGGGFATGATATTGTDGVATIGSWTLGATPGANTLTASASGVSGSPVTFSATSTGAAEVLQMSKTAGDGQSVAVGTAVQVLPAILIQDLATMTPKVGVTVTFAVTAGGGSITGATTTTNALGIATVGSWTLGSTAGVNTLSATASGVTISTGNPASFSATGIATFSPTTNTTLSGTLLVGSVSIPAGVTVTMTGDVTLLVSGSVNIAGTLIGDCRNLSISTDGSFTSTGAINNGCSTTPAVPPALTIVAHTGYHAGGSFTLGGSLNLTNDATLTDATFPATSVSAPHRVPARGPLLRDGPTCLVATNATFVAVPAHAADGVAGPSGGTGADAATWILQCTGELDFSSGVLVAGQDGGAGGDATDTRGSGAVAVGGNGGKGGTIKVRANNGDVVVPAATTGTSIESGAGGAGGDATATGTLAGRPGGGATATGGKGAAPGNVIVESNNGNIRLDGALTVASGDGGNGGTAVATAADGSSAPTCPAGQGGAAAATGGAGGTTPDKQLLATGSVTGTIHLVVVDGNGGAGGSAKATGGRGGPGVAPAAGCINGGAGGFVGAVGGAGGNSLLKDANGALFGAGGDGGIIELAGGNGGDGFNMCTRPNIGLGGTGGSANGTSGSTGAAGTGRVNGAAAAGRLNGVVNGGNGGKGLQPGHGGFSGFNGATSTLPFNMVAASLTAGQPGVACTLTFTATFTPVADPGHDFDAMFWHLAGTRTVTVQPGPVVTGQQGADGTYAQALGAAETLALNGEFFTVQNQPGGWNSHMLDQTLSGGTVSLVVFGGIFSFPATQSGVHFEGMLSLHGTFAGPGQNGADITYNVVMDAQ
jgi:adhesin/invasin